MTPILLNYLCEPNTKASLHLVKAVRDADGNIESGELVAPSGKRYPIKNGIPRFVDCAPTESVTSFGDEWNYFNFTQFKAHWLTHTVANTFGSTSAFKDKFIVDAGGGSGAQSKWFAEYGARHVILLELSHAIDDVVKRNLSGLRNVDAIQCSIDSPPIRDRSIDGIVYCHNVIQHTESVEKTARALFALAAEGGELVFNCYPKNDAGLLRWTRFHLIYRPLRRLLSRLPFRVLLLYSSMMGVLRLLPGIGIVLEKSHLCAQGDVPLVRGEPPWERLKRRFDATRLNTFDAYGSHKFQHHKSDDEIKALVAGLQPDLTKVLNMDGYFARPPKIGCALRVFKT